MIEWASLGRVFFIIDTIQVNYNEPIKGIVVNEDEIQGKVRLENKIKGIVES